MSAPSLNSPAFDPETVPVRTGTNYPAPFSEGPCKLREKRALGDFAGLTNFGVNLVRLVPGTESALRHWHSRQDELIYILEGELVLVTDEGEQTLTPGMAAGFKAGDANGHHLINRSGQDALYLEVGDRTQGDEVDYPSGDIAGRWIDGKRVFTRRDGTPY